jgi:hypothetical protein
LMKLVWVTKAKEATIGRLRGLLFGQWFGQKSCR